jgi:LAO/AO transport system kinase
VSATLAAPIDHRAVGQLLTIAERGGPEAATLDRIATTLAGQAHVVGITGPPGAGKSSLIGTLIAAYRTQDQRVGVVATDPSSRRGGAVLGDRVRMHGHSTDPGVFIRSMASRGQQGGLSAATPRAVRILDAAGFDVVIIESVGAGQLDIDIAGHADTTVIVVPPEAGDDIQAMKAGQLEIADVFVVNKADLPGADRAEGQLRARVLAEPRMGAWLPPVIRTDARTGAGAPELVAELARHRTHLVETGLLNERRAARRSIEARAGALQQLVALLDGASGGAGVTAEELVEDVLRRLGERKVPDDEQ